MSTSYSTFDSDQQDRIVDYIESRPAVYSTEISDLLDMHRNAANRRLEELATHGRVDWRRPHEHVPKIWYVPE